jgi:hypothetical protein
MEKFQSGFFVTGRGVFSTMKESGIRGGFVVFFNFGQIEPFYEPLVALAVLLNFLEKLFHLGVGEERIQVVLGVGKEFAQHNRFLLRRGR